MAQVTFPAAAVESILRSTILDILLGMPFELFVGDEAPRISSLEKAQEGLAIHSWRRLRARGILHMMGDAADRRKARVAEWADDASADMNLGVHVLERGLDRGGFVVREGRLAGVLTIRKLFSFMKRRSHDLQ